MAPSRALTEFVAEATEILEAFDRDFSALEVHRGSELDPDLLNGVFRAAHTLKGLSAMSGHEHLARLAHRAEDVLDALRLGRVTLTEKLMGALGESIAVLRALLAEVAREAPTAPLAKRAEALGNALVTLSEGGLPSAAKDLLEGSGLDPQVRAVLTEYEEHRLTEALKKGLGLWRVRAVFALGDFDQGLARLNALLRPNGEVVSTLPSSQPSEDTSIAFDLLFASDRSREGIEAALSGAASLSPLHLRAGSSVQRPESVAASSDSAALSSESSESGVSHFTSSSSQHAETSLRTLAQTVRVDIESLNALMNSIGELLLIRSNIERLASAASQPATTESARERLHPKLWSQELQREARSLARKLDELQKGVLDVRMVPLGQVFDRLARLMRRLLRESGKEVDFDVSGGQVELDKLIVEELSDPLMHLLRNALDHGIEEPDLRAKAGKSRRGKLRIRARQHGNHVVIEVGDDGAGMNDDRIRQVALARGLLTPAQAAELPRRELLNMVFQPGFSTRTDVSELSGRGVGLDVVRTNLARLSGLIDIDSRPGEGTTFLLTLPLTLAIIRALMVVVSERIYAVPLNSVLEIISARSSELRTIERREVLTVRGSTLPFIRLARVFGLEAQPVDRFFVVIVGLGEHRVGFAVDGLMGQQDIVTKPLTGRLRGLRGVSGATELGDRRAVLVLDVGALINEQLRPQPLML